MKFCERLESLSKEARFEKKAEEENRSSYQRYMPKVQTDKVEN